eukprot:8003301-Pyramimonas_sp.AAC.1
MATRGWAMFGGPALPTEKGRASGGVCILVRSHLDCWAPDDGCLRPGRAARCYILSSELGVILMGTVYMHVGEGLTPRNLKLIRCLGMAALVHKS